MIEEWKEAEGWDGKYEVSNTGEVRNAWDNVPVAKVIAGIPQYWYVNLSHPDGWRKLERVHRLVAFAFVTNDEPETKDVSLGALQTNMSKRGMTLEEALFTPRQRVKRLSINSVYNTPKYWFESFGINPRSANSWKSKGDRTFKETLEHFGVDTSEMVISLV